MSDKISVIIPCHNAEKYIERCLDSIIAQTYKNLEIIVVNDASTDKSRKLVERYLSDIRVRCIDHKENGGDCAARNTGLQEATGEYLGFVDADDYIKPDMYEKMHRAISESHSDFAVCNFNMVYEHGDKDEIECYSNMSDGVVNVYDNVYSYWANNCSVTRPNNYLWSRLYRKSLLDEAGIKFEKYRYGTDTLFNFKLLPHAKKVAFVNEGLYYYVQRGGSLIHTTAKKENIAALYAVSFQAIVDYYKENNFAEFIHILPLHAYSRLRSVFFYSRLGGLSDDVIIEQLIESWKDKDIYKYLTDKFN